MQFKGVNMQGALKNLYLSEEEYLAVELLSQNKNEYVSSQVFAMTGASKPHNKITGNVYVALRANASKNCRV
jgi:translation elongation factor EF-Tu-like GTPase